MSTDDTAVRDLIPPLAPIYRRTGQVFVLTWKSHNEGHHIIVTERRASLLPAYKVAFAKFRDVEVVSQHVGLAVLPPAWLSKVVAEKRFVQAIQDFKNEVEGNVQMFEYRFARLPREVEHYAEGNYERVRPVGKTWIEYMLEKKYRPFRHAWKAKLFAGQVADEDKPLLVFGGDYGICAGTVMSASDLSGFDSDDPCVILQDAQAEAVDPAIGALEDEDEAAKKAKKAAREAEWETGRKEQDEKDMRRLREFFGEEVRL